MTLDCRVQLVMGYPAMPRLSCPIHGFLRALNETRTYDLAELASTSCDQIRADRAELVINPRTISKDTM